MVQYRDHGAFRLYLSWHILSLHYFLRLLTTHTILDIGSLSPIFPSLFPLATTIYHVDSFPVTIPTTIILRLHHRSRIRKTIALRNHHMQSTFSLPISSSTLSSSNVPNEINRQQKDIIEMPSSNDKSLSNTALKIVVIGGGWAGFTVADALSSSATSSPSASFTRLDITVIDASEAWGGLASGWNRTTTDKNHPSNIKSKKNQQQRRSVEVGIHGFWREYRNTFDVIENSIGLNVDHILTPYTPSVLYSSCGRVALAPVFGNSHHYDHNKTPRNDKHAYLNNSIFSNIANILPSPLNVALLSEFTSSKLQLLDRISGISLLPTWIDFNPHDRSSWYRYDQISAENLFRSSNLFLSNRIYQELIVPLLHVLPMTTPYDCSAAAALSCFHVFALQSKGAFDVRWCRGSISDYIFQPWQQKLSSSSSKSNHRHVSFLRGTKVTSIHEKPQQPQQQNPAASTIKSQKNERKQQKFEVTITNNMTTSVIECDVIVIAVGITAAKRLLQTCPILLSDITKDWNKLKGVTCVAVRLFFDNQNSTQSVLFRMIRHAMKDSPVAVCGPKIGNIPLLTECGFCIYDLQRLQDEYRDHDEIMAMEIDFFRADAFVNHTDNEIIKLALQAISHTFSFTKPIDRQLLVDASVIRAREAVSHFTVNSAKYIHMDGVTIQKNRIYACGDWIDRAGHSSWSTEKAVVTGRQVAESILQDYHLPMKLNRSIIPALRDSEIVATLRQMNHFNKR